MFRKVGMILISVILKAAGSLVQAFSVFVVILFFTLLTHRTQPYLTLRLNSLELISLVTSGVTIYCGFFFLASKDPSSPSFNSTEDCNCS